MSRLLTLAAVDALAAGFVLAAEPTPAPAAAPPGGRSYIVAFRTDAVGAAAVCAAAADLARAHGLAVTHVYDTVLQGFAARVPDAALAGLRRDPRVAGVEPNLPVAAAADRLPRGVDRIGADGRAEGREPTEAGRPVAVFDTGIDPDHPDLNVRGGVNCTSEDAAAWADDNGHGTHVAGIIGAENDGVGVVGVAPGTPLWAVKVLDAEGRGDFGFVLCGLDWAARRGITVANLSLSGRIPGDDPTVCASSFIHVAFCQAARRGVRVVAAAGNAGINAEREVPAKYDQVIAVSALADSDGCAGGRGPRTWAGPDDTLAFFSNWGEVVDTSAPGVDIRSTWPGGRYALLSGTSMAAPHVAGAIARGWDGREEPGPRMLDPDGFEEGIVNLSRNTACGGR